MSATIHGRARALHDDSSPVDIRQDDTAARISSESLRLRLEWQFQKEADRLGIPFADARLLCVNSVRL